MRKEDKLRPYRIDYFIHDEMLKDKALVRSASVRDVTAKAAEKRLADSLGLQRTFTVIRSYRFYKKIAAEPKKKVYKPVDQLLPAKKAIEVMTEIENRRMPIVIRPEDLRRESNRASAEQSVTFKEVKPSDVRLPKEYFTDVKVLPPTILPPSDDIVFKKIFAPCTWHGADYLDENGRCMVADGDSEAQRKYRDSQRPTPPTGSVEAVIAALDEMKKGPTVSYDIETAYQADTQDLTFPNKPLIPTQPAVFDDSALQKINLDDVAPVLQYPPQNCGGEGYISPTLPQPPDCDCVGCTRVEDARNEYNLSSEFPAEEVVNDVINTSRKASYIVGAAVLAIAGLVFAYFHYFAR